MRLLPVFKITDYFLDVSMISANKFEKIKISNFLVKDVISHYVINRNV